jgi:class 3 adenylate cyclase
MSPLKVSNMLDRLDVAFDKIAKDNNVFKVETIGDAFMGVTNLEKKQEETHVKDAALFAIALVNEASKILIDENDPSKGYVNIRVGFHSGPVVSNVIGSLNPRYGLFGDTVKTSSRMESNSKANRIMCSEASFNLLQEQAPDISWRRRGKIAIKGKGEMVVYWIGEQEVNPREAVDLVQQGDDTKRVRIAEDSDDEEPVEDEMWRRELATKKAKEAPVSNSKQKSSKAKPEPEAPSSKRASKGKPEQAPPKKYATSKKHVKEAVHMKRSKY